MTEELLKRLDTSANAFRKHPIYDSDGDPVRLTSLADDLDEAAALIRQLKADNERMRAGFDRQTESMAFILNHATLPEQWYDKLSRELEEDRAAQSLNQTERGE